MTEPVLFKKGSFLVVLMTLVQAVLPAIVALICLYACMVAWGNAFDKTSPAVAIAGVLCLVLVQAPRQVSSQLTNSHLSAASSVFASALFRPSIADCAAVPSEETSICLFPGQIWRAV